MLWGLFQYDATVPGGHGGGGEYELQVGFGWTNGVIMELLYKYGDRLTALDRFTEPESKPNYQSDSRINVAAAASLPSVGQVLTGIVALVVTFATGCIG